MKRKTIVQCVCIVVIVALVIWKTAANEACVNRVNALYALCQDVANKIYGNLQKRCDRMPSSPLKIHCYRGADDTYTFLLKACDENRDKGLIRCSRI